MCIVSHIKYKGIDMSSLFDRICSEQLIKNYPSHMKNNIQYECIMGSVAYGVSDDTSDMDIYGFCIPPKHILFPYNHGYILGFGKKPEGFDQFQKHHIIDPGRAREYDISIYNIVKFFNLCMENNPNMVDALFVPNRCVLHSNQVGEYVRENRHIFLSKRCWHKFKGYAFSQIHKMKNKFAKDFVDMCNLFDMAYDLPLKDMLDIMKKKGATEEQCSRMTYILAKIASGGKRSKRIPLIAKHGFDTKFGYHVVRLIDECEQILEEGDLDLTRSREHLKAIRRGEWKLEDIENYFDTKMKSLEKLYSESKLRYSPDEECIKTLLIDCLEMHYGNLGAAVGANNVDDVIRTLSQGIVKLEQGMQMLYRN